MIKHLCFSDHRMTLSAGRCSQSALKHGCNQTVIYSPMNIDVQFNMDNEKILRQDRGAGYWLWKPYFILKELQRSNEGDIIVYTDAGVEFVNDVNLLLDEMSHEIMVFGNGWRHGDWCKMDVLKDMEGETYADYDQCQATCIILINSDYSKRFVEEWLHWCTMPDFIDDTPSKTENYKTFREHRHDQAILTNLVYREGLPLNRWPAQYKLRGNEKYKNKYPVIFNHHGLRDNGKRT